MTAEDILEMFQNKDDDNTFMVEWSGDNAFQGLQILAKYLDPKEHELIQGAGHDVIWSVNVEKIAEAGITEEDVLALIKLNWMVEDESYLACFV